MRKITQATGILSFVSVGEMFLRFVRTKCIAIFLGAAGVGFLGQLTLLFETLRIWGDVGARRVVVRQVAECKKDGQQDLNRYKQVLNTSFVLVISVSSLMALVVTVLSKVIARGIYGDPAHYKYIIAVALTIPVASLTTLVASILKGNLEYKNFSKYTTTAYMLVMISTPFLIYFFRYWGAVAVQLMFFALPLAGYLWLNKVRPYLLFAPSIDFHKLKEQLFDGINNLYTSSVGGLAKFIVAIWITRILGLEQMGFYQVVITFTSIYLTIPIQAITGYTLPLIASSSDVTHFNDVANDTVRFLIFFLAPIIVALMVIPELFIRVFYSAEFLPVVSVLRVFLLGTVFLGLEAGLYCCLVAKGKLKAMYITDTATHGTFALFSLIFLERFQLMSVAYAYVFSNFVGMALCFWILKKYLQFHLYPKNVRLLLATVLWVVLALASTFFYENNILARIAALFFALPWFFLSSKDHERKFLWEKFKSVVAK